MLAARQLHKAGSTQPWTHHVQPCHYSGGGIPGEGATYYGGGGPVPLRLERVC